MSRSGRRTVLLFLLAVCFAVWSVGSGQLHVPERWNPLAPLDIDAAPNLFTGYKFSRASTDDAECLSVLKQATMRWTPLDDRRTGEACGLFNAVRIERTSVSVGEPFSLSCRAALSLAMWETHVLQEAALSHLGSRVQAIEHYGSYACRNLYNRAGGRRSQHATADALDIAGFILEDGRRIRVLGDWAAPESTGSAFGSDDADATRAAAARAGFLRQSQRGACRYFDAVLGPDYNRAHADHFHFDRGRARICR